MTHVIAHPCLAADTSFIVRGNYSTAPTRMLDGLMSAALLLDRDRLDHAMGWAKPLALQFLRHVDSYQKHPLVH